jgi:hypothetical protein
MLGQLERLSFRANREKVPDISIVMFPLISGFVTHLQRFGGETPPGK